MRECIARAKTLMDLAKSNESAENGSKPLGWYSVFHRPCRSDHLLAQRRVDSLHPLDESCIPEVCL